MNQPDTRARLVRCFAAVFRALTPQQIETATTGNVAAWDSLAMIELATVVDEEFGTETDFDLLSQLDSFDAFLTHVQRTDAVVRP
jgi:acyl carrier protein